MSEKLAREGAGSLRDSQKADLRKIQERLSSAVTRLAPRGARSQEVTPSKVVQGAELANTFGVLGSRGAGKSTLLRALSGRVEVDGVAAAGSTVLLAPIDCSIVRPDVAPGAAVLLHLENQLRAMRARGEIKIDVEPLCKGVSSLAELYSETTEPYRQLGMELSSSPEDYKHFVLSGMNRRFLLREGLNKWLNDALEKLDDSGAFVVFLDDFDLVHAGEVRKWILSLLDELQQRRLLFVLAADYYRLQHLSWDPKAEFDDKTGRALLEKLLPPQNRCELKPWAHVERWEFRLDPGTETLGELVKPFSLNCQPHETLLKNLLPFLPRGLENLYLTLVTEPLPKDELAKATAESGEALDRVLRKFLGLLAGCRGEALLARRLSSTPTSAWVKILQFGQQDLPVEEWQAMVETAILRWTQKEDGKPLPGLIPVAQARSGQRKERDEGRGPEASQWGVTYYVEALLHNPSDPDTLRHDDLLNHPLRDAPELSQPYWSELLLSLGFLPLGKGGKAEAVRNRIRFLQSWAPAVERLRRAKFEVMLTRSALRDFFEDPRAMVPRSSLLWLFWEPGEQPVVGIGWHPLLTGLRGARDPLLSEQFADLLVGVSNFEGDMPKVGDVDELSLVPDQLWAMILLIDGLDRCPWKAFSAPLGWLLGTYIQVAAAFVRTAYVFALEASCGLSSSDFSEPQKKFLEALKSRDPLELLALEEEKIQGWMAELFSDDLSEKVKNVTGSLSTAAGAYLKSPVYQAAAKLSAPVRGPAVSARLVGRRRAR